MNDIQKDYLIGLLLKKIEEMHFESFADVNANNDQYINNISQFSDYFIMRKGKTLELISFIVGDQVLFIEDGVEIEEIGLYLTCKADNKRMFTISKAMFMDILKLTYCYFVDYLPLGTIVKTSEEKLVMIEQKMLQLKGSDYYIDYRAIPYPTGIFNESMYIYLSRNDISEVVFQGYEDMEGEGYELALKESLMNDNILSIEFDEKEDL